ncbi:MAG TPA: 4-(cytidine 5'-diphospho)-2-C-methyl-D-erythritol kinase [Candidatus Omnitrophota bacterium]|nr:4-(cytidine 5'-diphospho)-2-C-methyl-D-erythritol kinase [Candidatus Omnitrophota bacterium]
MSAFHSKTIEIKSFAKLNLFLDVLGKRPDGFHELETVFERISLHDTIRLTSLPSGGIVVKSNSSEIPKDHTNIAFKAAELVSRSYGIKNGIKIEILKNIPVGAGLAGGSSNAASVLLGLNRLFSLKLSKKKLLEFADKLGSDVAFFIYDRTFALGRGRGGELSSLSLPKNLKIWHILFSPGIKVLTKDVYGLLDREEKRSVPGGTNMLTKKTHNVNILASCLRRQDIDLLNQNIYNRLSGTVMNAYSFVSDIKTELNSFGLKYVHMSGSGPTLFTVFKTRAEAEKIFKKLLKRFKKLKISLTSSA